MIRDQTVARRRAPPRSAFLGDLRNFHDRDSDEPPLARGGLATHELLAAGRIYESLW